MLESRLAKACGRLRDAAGTQARVLQFAAGLDVEVGAEADPEENWYRDVGRAVGAGDLDRVRECIPHLPNGPMGLRVSNATMVGFAAALGFHDIATMLREPRVPGDDDEKEGGGGPEPSQLGLCRAVAAGDVALARSLLGAGVDATACGCSLLEIAASLEHADVVELLLAHGADIDARNRFGHTALFTASRQRDLATQIALLASGADVNVVDNLGSAPLHQAHDAVAAIALLAHGANLDATSSSGETPLQAAALRGRAAVVNVLLAHGAAVNLANRFAGTALHSASQNGHASIVTALLEFGASATTGDCYGRTPLHVAMSALESRAWRREKPLERDVLAVVRALVAHGADVDAVSSAGSTPLAAAVDSDQPRLADVLRSAGASLDLARTAVKREAWERYEAHRQRRIQERVACALGLGLRGLLTAHLAREVAAFL